MAVATLRFGLRICGLICCFVLLFPLLANAQDWQNHNADDGAYVYGNASPTGVGFGVACNAPSAQGLPPVQVGAHEESLTGPFNLRLEMSSELITGYEPRRDVVLWLGQSAYRLPLIYLNELVGVWEFELSMADPMVAALRQAPRLVLAPGSDQPVEIPVGGIDATMRAAMQVCVDAWAVAGHTIPTALNEFWPPVGEDAPLATPAAGPMGDILAAAANRRIAEGCRFGLKSIEPGTYVSGDIDQDGVADLLLDWAGVECFGTNLPETRPYCGASHCSVDLFLSRSFQREGIYETLAIGGKLVRNAAGGLDVELGRGLASCDDPMFGPGCITRLRWTGAALDIIK